MIGNQRANRSKGTRVEYSRSSEQTARKGLECLGIREQTAREGLEYSRSSEQTARKGLECLGIREQTARQEGSSEHRVEFGNQGANRSKGTRVIGNQGANRSKGTRVFEKQ